MPATKRGPRPWKADKVVGSMFEGIQNNILTEKQTLAAVCAADGLDAETAGTREGKTAKTISVQWQQGKAATSSETLPQYIAKLVALGIIRAKDGVQLLILLFALISMTTIGIERPIARNARGKSRVELAVRANRQPKITA